MAVIQDLFAIAIGYITLDQSKGGGQYGFDQTINTGSGGLRGLDWTWKQPLPRFARFTPSAECLVPRTPWGYESLSKCCDAGQSQAQKER